MAEGSRRGPAFYFALAILLLFGISLFSVILSVPASNIEPTVTPQADSAQFKGFGAVEARVINLGSQLVVQCSSATGDVAGAIGAVKGITTAYKAGGEIFVAF